MSDHGKGLYLNAETIIMLGLIAILFTAAVVSHTVLHSPILTAVCVGLLATTFLHHFLGGVKGSNLTLMKFKAGGSVAVFAVVVWFVNDALVKQNRVEIYKGLFNWMEMSPNASIKYTGKLKARTVTDLSPLYP